MRVALSSYRSKPTSGGQGVYVRNLSRELVALGHAVEVFSGQPYPELDDGVRLTPVPSLDLYRDDDPFRTPALREFRDGVDVLEYATMCTAGFPEPRTFGLRLARLLRARAGEFDVLHDNQTLAPGLLRVARRGLPVVTTIHHPITRDRRLALADARGGRRVSVRRWYGFVAMQARVARRSGRLVTVSDQAADDVAADFGVPRERLRVVPVGVDVTAFRPTAPTVPGRIVTVTSADVPLKGLPVLVRALAGVRRSGVDAELVVVGSPSDATTKLVADAGLTDRVRFVSGLAQPDLVDLVSSAQVAGVPSLYEGFCLPALEAMACGTPVVGSRVGALPDLVGSAGDRGRVVPPGDDAALAAALRDVLTSPEGAARLGAAARAHVERRYTWRAVAAATADVYREAVEGTPA